MPAAQIELERLGNTHWIGAISGPRGCCEIGRNPRVETTEELLAAIRSALEAVGTPFPPSAPLLPTPPIPQPEPRHVRGAPRGSVPEQGADKTAAESAAVSDAAELPAPTWTKPVPLSKSAAAKMRKAADEAIDATIAGASERRAQIASRRFR